MNLFTDFYSIVIILGIIFCFSMSFGMGANDVSNAMGTSVGAGVLTSGQAVFIASFFEFFGAYLAGGEVTHTIKNGIINLELYAQEPRILLIGMVAVLFSTSVWLYLASYKGWPVSSTHALIGAFIGFACVTVGASAVAWGSLLTIVGSWIITPLISGSIAFIVFKTVQKFIFDKQDPILHAKRYGPFYMGITTFIISLVTIKKGLSHIGIHIPTGTSYIISTIIGISSIIIFYLYFRFSNFSDNGDDQILDLDEKYKKVEKVFSILMIITACSMAFAHGSNDVSHSIGPMAIITSVINHNGAIVADDHLTWWLLPLGGLGMVCGMLVYGHKVMGTIGNNITHLTPSRGFSSEFATATTVIIATGSGLPISTTQTLIGAVLGVGFARGIAALNLRTIRNIFASWIITIPAGAVFCIISFFILKICL